MNFKRKLIVITLVFFVNFFLTNSLLAEVGIGIYQPQTIDGWTIIKQDSLLAEFLAQQAARHFSQTISAAEAAAGGVVSAWDGIWQATYLPGQLSAESQITVSELARGAVMPWSLDQLSPVYNYQFSALAKPAPLTVKIAYSQTNNYFKQVYYFDSAAGVWKALPTTDYPQEKFVRAVINQASGRLAVFAKPGVLTVGQASWYAYRGGLFAASPDFPKGSRLRVTNLDNGKTVEVTVNDWGPERAKHPERVVDLDKIAFSQLAPTSAGVIRVMVSPIELTADRDGRVLGVRAGGVANTPLISSRSAIIVKEDTGEVLLNKNGDQKLPLASLTKLVALKVFLNEQPNLDLTISYKLQDEKYNYLYIPKAQLVRVKLKEGDQVKVKDMLYAALVGSANNAVETLVRTSGLAREDFIKKMNELVKSWGATQTKFVEPSGLAAANVSSVSDYAIIMKEALKDEVIARATIEPSYVFFTQNTKKRHVLNNTNKLIVEQAQNNLRAEKFAINGSKTGYLNEAGYCLATRVQAKDGNYIIVTFGSATREKSFNEMTDLIHFLNRLI